MNEWRYIAARFNISTLGNKAVSSWFQFLVEELILDGRWYMKGISQLQKGRLDDPVMDTHVPVHSGLLESESGKSLLYLL